MAIFGEIYSIPEGSSFERLQEAEGRGLLSNRFRGISSGKDVNGIYGADAVVLNGGYRYDRDYGDRIIYTGESGNVPGSLEIVMNQTLTARNKALLSSYTNNLPVRVIRGSKLESIFAPAAGYRYDGLFQIVDVVDSYTPEGFLIYQFIMEKMHSVILGEDKSHVPIRAPASYERIIRDTKIAVEVKLMYRNMCQFCGIRLSVSPDSYYAEGAHIKPLGKPYDGPDAKSNLLCLCPNHHVQFDRYRISIDPDSLDLVGMSGKLRVAPDHHIEKDYLWYHYDRFMEKQTEFRR